MKLSLKLKQLVLAAAALLLASHPALAEKRVALVLGNSAYRNAPPLPNPVNDATVVAKMLKDAGFDYVDFRTDLSATDTRRELRDFADRARDADIAVVYYAGHGMEVDGANYLVPVDAKLERDTDVYDEALSLDRVLVAIEPARTLRLVILDACRDNPFAKSMKRTLATRGIGQGLAKVEPSSPNVLIAYSAKAGSTAADGDGKNSPFTLALSKYLPKPGLDVRRAFGYVRDDVLKTTANRQEPFVYGSLGGEDVALVPAQTSPAVAAAMPPSPDQQSDVRRDYELAVQIGSKDAMNAFLAQHPDGYYANLAKLRLAGDQSGVKPSAPADRPTTIATLATGSPQADVTKSVQNELRRVGCFSDAADGNWNATSQRSLTLFNRYAGTKLDTKTASVNTLDTIKQKSTRVCPLACEHGFKADGDHCAKIVCAEGSVLNSDNECEKPRARKPVAARDSDDRPSRRERAARSAREPSAAIPRLQAGADRGGGGQVVCSNDTGCRPLNRGCHIEYRGGGGPGVNVGNVEVCN